MEKLKRLLHAEPVLCIFALAALLSFFPAAPTLQQTAGYIDWSVLVLLFCLMAASAGLQKEGLLEYLSQRFVSYIKDTRMLYLGLTLLCFFSSMLLTNDVALITFVPFACTVLTMAGQEQRLIFVIVLQTVAANLGSMLTPFGNPQNLFLYAHYEMGLEEFLHITAPLCGLSLLLVSALALMQKKAAVFVRFSSPAVIRSPKRMGVYLLLLAVCLMAVLHLLPWYLLPAVILPALFFCDRSIFSRVDYGLLGSFVCFFLFAGNLGNIPSFQEAASVFIDGHERLAGILLSQLISNVPAAVLLSGFTGEAAGLIQGVNIGGLGTLIASLASLISFKYYSKTPGARPLQYLAVFTAVNLFSLLLLYGIACIL